MADESDRFTRPGLIAASATFVVAADRAPYNADLYVVDDGEDRTCVDRASQPVCRLFLTKFEWRAWETPVSINAC